MVPETFTAVRCPSKTNCKWDKKKWYDAIDSNADETTIRERINREKLSPGFTHVHDSRYLLRYCLSTFYSWKMLTIPQTRSYRIRLHYAQNHSRSILGE
jgi:hypothetical protein